MVSACLDESEATRRGSLLRSEWQPKGAPERRLGVFYRLRRWMRRAMAAEPCSEPLAISAFCSRVPRKQGHYGAASAGH
jgi:hypothetical protein